MSTRCRIGIENEDGTIESIYCHNDGYPSYAGKLLYMHYNNREKINKLMQLGDMSCLGTEPVDAGWNNHIPYDSISHFIWPANASMKMAPKRVLAIVDRNSAS